MHGHADQLAQGRQVLVRELRQEVAQVQLVRAGDLLQGGRGRGLRVLGTRTAAPSAISSAPDAASMYPSSSERNVPRRSSRRKVPSRIWSTSSWASSFSKTWIPHALMDSP